MTDETTSLFYSAPIDTLQTATSQLVVYSEVQLTLQSLLEDVETTQSINAVLHVQELQRQLQSSLAELEERRACDAIQSQQLQNAGDLFVGELFALSKKFSNLEQEVEKNRKKMQQFDSMQRKLERSEELVRTLQRTMSLNRNAYGTNNSLQSEETPCDMENILPPEEVVEAVKPTIISQEEEEPNVLESLDETLILHIFSYLDAIDVVHTAMVNVSFYARVDSLFGLTSSSTTLNNNKIPADDANMVKEETKSDSLVTSMPLGSMASKQKLSNESATVVTSTPTLVVTANETTISMSQKPPAKESTDNTSVTNSMAKNSTVPTTPPLAPAPPPRNALANVLSILGQPKTPQTTSRKTPALPGSSAEAPPSGTATTSSDATKSFASMANSMAEKLTPSELAVIIRMTEQIRSKDREISKIRAEREDLAARLEGTEAVKEFLISKIKDTERSLKKYEEDAAKALQQYSCDQELISFLDYRVKELERLWKETKNNLTDEQKQALEFKEKSQKRQVVLEDMLEFERQQLSDSEREWKATKKILVKEVKHCRAQLLALQAERDSYRQKNLQLKQALLTMNVSGGPK